MDRATLAEIVTVAGPASIPLPDAIGALLLKARAYVADTRGREHHLLDLAQLCASVTDPLAFRDALDGKEGQALCKVQLSSKTTEDPWLRFAQIYGADALEVWEMMVSRPSGA